MALRTIRIMGDEILTKKAKEIKEITPGIRELAEDMKETMYQAFGVGLAAPQVGVLKRMVVIDTTEDHSGLLVLINPKVTNTEGTQTGTEGCLSVPGKFGIVTRPNLVTVEAMNLEGEIIKVTGEELLARALVHEIDHLDGHLYVEKVEGELEDTQAAAQEETE